MAEIIDLRHRQDAQHKQRQDLARRRAGAVAAALSCGLCPRRCAHCGLPVEDQPAPAAPMPYPFCGPCLEEYQAYQRRQQGQTTPEAYWHTAQWQDMWRLWLESMRANDDFRRTPEFLRLMEEIKD